jgi:hypothetical protein
MNDENVTVWGNVDDDENLYCEWHETAEWIPIDDPRSGLEQDQ